jgi:hypothetical protein
VRDAIARLLPDDRFPTVRQVGGWWPRSNSVEIDLVGTDARPGKEVGFVGSIKWHRRKPLTRGEVSELAHAAAVVPGVGAGTPLVAVCPAGAEPDSRLLRVWTADDLLSAWI